MRRIPQPPVSMGKPTVDYLNEVNRVNSSNFQTIENTLGPLAELIKSSNTNKGVLKFGGMAVQYGSVTGIDPSVTFEVVYSAIPTCIIPVVSGASTGVYEVSRSTTGFTTSTGGVSATVNWIAFGVV